MVRNGRADRRRSVPPALLGQAVVGENIRPCTTCAPCRHGNAPACETDYQETGFTLDGAWADHVVVPADLLHVLPPDATSAPPPASSPPRAPPPRSATQNSGGDSASLYSAAAPSGCCARSSPAQPAARSPSSTATHEPRPRSTMRCQRVRGSVGRRTSPLRRCHRGGRSDRQRRPRDSTGPAGRPDRDLRDPPGRRYPPDDRSRRQRSPVRHGVRRAHDVWRDAVDAFVAGHLDPGLLVTPELSLDNARAHSTSSQAQRPAWERFCCARDTARRRARRRQQSRREADIVGGYLDGAVPRALKTIGTRVSMTAGVIVSAESSQ